MKQHEIPSQVELLDGCGGLTRVIVRTPWSTAEIYLHGAHVTHFQKTGEAPLLFMSAKSEFAEGKAIRGGVPVIFPWFGPREGYPAHGYARTSLWTLTESSVSPDGAVSLHFRLPSSGPLAVEYVVKVAAQLTLELVVSNPTEDDVEFENCLHTYFQIGSIHDVSVVGLTECNYYDKLLDATFTQAGEGIKIEGEVDRIYVDTTAAVEIVDPALDRRIRIAKSGSESTVLWNPWIEKSKRMADFGDEEYLQMVCVESGNIATNKLTLAKGAGAIMKVELSSGPLSKIS